MRALLIGFGNASRSSGHASRGSGATNVLCVCVGCVQRLRRTELYQHRYSRRRASRYYTCVIAAYSDWPAGSELHQLVDSYATHSNTAHSEPTGCLLLQWKHTISRIKAFDRRYLDCSSYLYAQTSSWIGVDLELDWGRLGADIGAWQIPCYILISSTYSSCVGADSSGKMLTLLSLQA